MSNENIDKNGFNTEGVNSNNTEEVYARDKEAIEKWMKLYTSEITEKLELLFNKVEQIEKIKDNKESEEIESYRGLIAPPFSIEPALNENGTAYAIIKKHIKMSTLDFKERKLKSHLRPLMKKYRYSQDELASLIGVNRSTIISIINGKGVSLENAFKLSEVFEMPITELFSYSKDEKNHKNDE